MKSSTQYTYTQQLKQKKSPGLEPPGISSIEIKNVKDLIEEFGSKTNENINEVTEGSQETSR